MASHSRRKLTHEELTGLRLNPDRLDQTPRLPVVALLDNVRSLYNVGSVFRTSDGAFVNGLYLCGFTPHPPRREIEKTALGATKSVPWKYFRHASEALAEARAAGMRVLVLEHTTGSMPYDQMTRADFPICLVVGNEITGVSDELIAAADGAIDIPMHGTKQSLNAAVAYGIAVFELRRIWSAASEERVPRRPGTTPP
jgi:tRNA G18 (ribose-2'-O)-methylase SpoU